MKARTKHRIHGLVLSMFLASVASAQTQLFEVAGDKSADHFGTSTACAGDFNNDGYPDLIVGAPEDAAVFVAGEGFARVHSGLNGAVLQMFSHGVLGAALFALVGGVIYVRTKTRQLGEFHRLADRMPGVAWTFVVAGLASMGLPGFSGFVAELYALIGVWKADHLGVSVLVISGLGILLAFGYVLVKTHEAFFRKNPAVTEEEAATTYEPMTCPEKAACFLLLGSSLAVGLYPTVLTQWIEPSLKPILDNVDLVVK